MKRKILVTILSLIMGLSIVACGKQGTPATTESVPATVESTQAESTEEIKETETENESTEKVEPTETVEETTESTEEMIEAIDIEKGEPLSEKDLTFSFLGYDTYNEYVEAGNTYSAPMAYEGDTEDTEDEDDIDVSIDSTVRGIKIGDSIDKVFELYGPADKYDKYGKGDFSHDGLEDVDRYMYFFTVDSTKDYFYSFSFITDQYSDVIGLIIEPISMKYWTED
ncbi:hypothetical protein [Simiaoa sp.]|uniref:hypothetical protein n=1 Tax=Simiaoa sp. TaxID=2944202 RepID=UPI003F7F20A7